MEGPFENARAENAYEIRDEDLATKASRFLLGWSSIMLVSCPGCATRHNLDDLPYADPEPGTRSLRLQCPQCSTVWLVPSKYADHRHPASSLPPPAVERAQGNARRRAHDRNQRDLFAPPPSDFGLPPPKASEPPVPVGGYGARNENSVLFTVEEIRNSARPGPMHGSAETAREDEGVIDLQALTLGKSQGAPVLSMFPSEPTPDAFSSEIAALGGVSEGGGRFGRWTKRQLAVGAGALAAALLCVVGLVVAFSGGEQDMSRSTSALSASASPDPATNPAATEAPAPPPASSPSEVPGAQASGATDPAPAAEASLTATGDSEEPVAAKGKHKGKHKGRGTHHAKPAKKAKAAAAAKPAKKAKSSDPCGCHGNFECTLRCAAKGK